MKFVIPILEAFDLSYAGGKAYNLARLCKLGVFVPNGVVVLNLSKNLETTNTTIEQIADEIFHSLKPPLIVRSSVSLEDSELASFAGIFESYFPITTQEGLLESFGKFKNALHSTRLQTYLSNYNIAVADLNVSLVVQEYIQGDYSGVVFTQDPSDANSLLVEYASGSSSVVSGTGHPKTIKLERKGGTASSSLLSKDSQNELSSILADDLIRTSLHIEQALGGPQDIEWVSVKDKLWFVQTRPITTQHISKTRLLTEEKTRLETLLTSSPPSLSAGGWLTGAANITPLTLSLFQRIYSGTGSLGLVYKSFFFPYKEFPAEKYLVSICSRVYVNRSLEAKMFREALSSGNQFFKNPYYWLRLRLSDTWFQIKLYLDIANLKPSLNRLSISADKGTFPEIIERIVHTTSVSVLTLSLYQEYIERYIQQYFKELLPKLEIQKLLRPAGADYFSTIVEREKNNLPAVLRFLGHRGLSETELSSPRFDEEPQPLLDYIKSKKRLVDSLPDLPRERAMFRSQVINRVPSLFEKIKIGTYLKFFDELTICRELAHDIWVKDLTQLRKLLLRFDQERKLFNTIWYASLSEILSGALPTAKQLKQRKERHNLLSQTSLPTELTLSSWVELGEVSPGIKHGQTFKGEGLVVGEVEGKVVSTGGFPDRKGILVVEALSPSLVVFFPKILGIVCEQGGRLSHAAIVAREYNIPIVRIDFATKIFSNNACLRINGSAGEVKIVT